MSVKPRPAKLYCGKFAETEVRRLGGNDRELIRPSTPELIKKRLHDWTEKVLSVWDDLAHVLKEMSKTCRAELGPNFLELDQDVIESLPPT